MATAKSRVVVLWEGTEAIARGARSLPIDSRQRQELAAKRALKFRFLDRWIARLVSREVNSLTKDPRFERLTNYINTGVRP